MLASKIACQEVSAYMLRTSLIVLLSVLIFADVSRSENADSTTEKLLVSKEAYDAEMSMFRKSIDEYFSVREDAARRKGDKELVDQITMERDAFLERGQLPKSLPQGLVQRLVKVRHVMEIAYRNAIKEFVREKKDKQAADSEQELETFLCSSPLFVFLFDVDHFDVRIIQDKVYKYFFKAPVTIGDKNFEWSIFTHPRAKEPNSVSFRLMKKWNTFVSEVALDQPTKNPKLGSFVTFEVLGDGKLLWRSKPTTLFEQIQRVQLDVSSVNTLTLKAQCDGDHFNCWAWWLNPKVLK